MSDLTKQTKSQQFSSESKRVDDKSQSSHGESPVLDAISAHLQTWYPQRKERDGILEEIVEKPPTGLTPPYDMAQPKAALTETSL